MLRDLHLGDSLEDLSGTNGIYPHEERVDGYFVGYRALVGDVDDGATVMFGRDGQLMSINLLQYVTGRIEIEAAAKKLVYMFGGYSHMENHGDLSIATWEGGKGLASMQLVVTWHADKARTEVDVLLEDLELIRLNEAAIAAEKAKGAPPGDANQLRF